MLRLKQANFADAAQEYAFVQTIPRCENGFTNDWLGWSYAEFVEKALPQMQRWARGEDLRLLLDIARDLVPEEEFFLRVNKDNPASLRVMLRNGAYIHHEDDARFYVRIPKNK